MSFRPISLRYATALALALSSLANALPSRAEDAASIVKKVSDRYLNAKSFQGVIMTHQSMTGANGQAATVDATQTVYVQLPGKYRFDVKAKGTGGAANASKNDHSMISDGKTLSVYYPASKQYIQNLAPKDFSMKQIVGSLLPQLDAFTPAGVSEGVANGQPTFIVLMKMQMPKNLPAQVTAEQKKQIEDNLRKSKPVKVIVNKRDYSLVEVVINGGAGKDLNIVISQQSFDKPIPASRFQFTPPAGAKLFTPPQTGGKP